LIDITIAHYLKGDTRLVSRGRAGIEPTVGWLVIVLLDASGGSTLTLKRGFHRRYLSANRRHR